MEPGSGAVMTSPVLVPLPSLIVVNTPQANVCLALLCSSLLWDILLTSYFSSVSAGCAAKQKYHTLCENLRSAQFLPREIITFLCWDWYVWVREEQRKNCFWGPKSPYLFSERAPELRSQVRSWQKGSLLFLWAPNRMQSFSQVSLSGTFTSKWHVLWVS
jgi:hypothetical protein